VLLGGQLVAAALYASAAVGFARRADRRGDELLAWLAIACVLGAFSRVNYFLFPSLYSDWVYVGDLFRLLFYVVLLAAALREITRYWEGIAAAAALEERRLIAREVHDGLAQELAYVARALPLLDGPSAADVRERVRAAVARARNESRRLIQTLAAAGEPMDVLVARAVGDAADRWGIELEFSLGEGLRAEGARRDALLRIAAEAVTNVGRHSGARAAHVVLEPEGARVRLRVSDDGCGFDPAAPVADRQSFGLVSMHERAVAVGGRLDVRSELGRGTTVEAVV
jgi:signal transduction histidine kinase